MMTSGNLFKFLTKFVYRLSPFNGLGILFLVSFAESFGYAY
jgi:hypothetical protein